MKSLFLSLVLVVYLLTAQALAAEKNVAVVHVGAVDQFSAADYPDSLNKYGIQNVINFLVDDGRFGAVVADIDVDQEGAAPTLERLLNYDAIMVVTDGWGTDSPFPSEILTGGGLGTQLGNVLDNYVLDGGRVVFTAYCGDLEYGIDGEILDFGLAPYTPQGVNFDDPSCLNMADAQLTHPVFENVSGFCPSYSSEINLQAPPGERLGRLLNGDECVLTTASDSIVGADAVMFVNGYPGTLADIEDIANPDFEVLFANALYIPEPATVFLLGFGSVAVLAKRKRDHS